MKREVIAILLSFIAIVAMAVFVPALVARGDPFVNLVTTYGPGQKIQGTVNFSLDEEPSNSIVKGQVQGQGIVTMKIKDFLDEASVTYVCDPAHCLETYNLLGSGVLSKTIAFSANQGYVGIKATETDVNVQDLKFKINGSGGASVCDETPVKLDLLDDGTIDWEYKEAGGWCDSNPGLNYNPDQATDENNIGSTPYCEKIEIEKTGKVMITANVRLDGNASTAGLDDLVFSIYDQGTVLGSCTPGKVTNIVFASKSCEVHGSSFYISEKKDFFVCVKNIGSEEYSIRSEGESPFSGFWGTPPSETFTKDYAIRVTNAGFAPFNGAVFFNSTVFLGDDLQDYLQDFIVERYNRDCSSGCGIPLKFIRTQATQQVIVSNLDFKITTSSGPTTKYDFYSIQPSYPTLTTSQENVNLGALNMTVPSSYNTYDFIFTLGAETETISFEVAQVPIIHNLNPLMVVPGTETTFQASVTSPKGNDIVSYSWDFGDGSTDQTTVPQARHTYMSTDSFSLILSATDSEGLIGTRTFSINVIITKEGLNNSITNKLDKITSFRSSVQGEWYTDLVLGALSLSATEATLNDLYSQIETADEQQLMNIKNQLDVLQIPLRLEDSLVFRTSEYIPSADVIRPDLVETMGGGSYNAAMHNEFVAQISEWFKGQGITTSGEVKTVVFQDGITQDLVTLAYLDVSLYDSQAYLLVSLPAGVDFNELEFKQNYNAESIENSFAIILTDSSIIEFALPGKQSISTLELFLSPNLDTLNVHGGTTGPIEGESAPWALAIFFIILIVLGGAAALYFIWKGKKFKGFSLGGLFSKKQVFKNPMDLFNLTNFIKAARARGMKKEEIEDKLKKAGWTNSQIKVAFKKVK